jgi:hypothetical protein
MVKRKPQSKQQQPTDEGESAKETIIEAEAITAKRPARSFSRGEIISAVAAVLSLAAIGLALWPVLTAKMTHQRQAELGVRVDELSAAVESLVAAQTELAEALVAQQGLSGALKTDLNKLTQQASNLTTELRSELDRLAQQLEKSQQDFLDSLSLPAVSTEPAEVLDVPSTSKTASQDAPSNIGADGGGQKPASLADAEEAPWLPQWVEVPMENLAGWFSGLITVRKNTQDHSSETPDAGKDVSQ